MINAPLILMREPFIVSFLGRIMMGNRFYFTASLLALLVFATLVQAANQSPEQNSKGATVSSHATGSFEVKSTPQPSGFKTEDPNLGRTTGEKRFNGDLEATSEVQMLTAGTSVKGSAAYVAIEKITGTLKGRSGTFILQHSGTMNRGVPQLTVTVVPDSGTGQLAGLSGKMSIAIAADGKHSYDLEFTLAETR
jgi:hypothetical protein